MACHHGLIKSSAQPAAQGAGLLSSAHGVRHARRVSTTPCRCGRWASCCRHPSRSASRCRSSSRAPPPRSAPSRSSCRAFSSSRAPPRRAPRRRPRRRRSRRRRRRRRRPACQCRHPRHRKRKRRCQRPPRLYHDCRQRSRRRGPVVSHGAAAQVTRTRRGGMIRRSSSAASMVARRPPPRAPARPLQAPPPAAAAVALCAASAARTMRRPSGVRSPWDTPVRVGLRCASPAQRSIRTAPRKLYPNTRASSECRELRLTSCCCRDARDALCTAEGKLAHKTRRTSQHSRQMQ